MEHILARPAGRLVVGNWKMHGEPSLLNEAGRLAQAVATLDEVRVALCPPATLLHRLSTQLAGSRVVSGGQDCHSAPFGAFTGDLSARMLVEAGARLVILGHSERRTGHYETDTQVAAKLDAALSVGLEPIVCVGETLADYEAGDTQSAISSQLAQALRTALPVSVLAIAYEPRWAIGGRTSAPSAHIERVHRLIRSRLCEIGGAVSRAPILYGGAVTGSSAANILVTPEVGGLLVGGASLQVETFLPIVQAASQRV